MSGSIADDRSNWGLGLWNGYVEKGSTRDERRQRLDEVPGELRAQVENHVRLVFFLRSGGGRRKGRR